MKTAIETLPCPYSDSILFQFILTELMHAHKEVNALMLLLEKLKAPSKSTKKRTSPLQIVNSKMDISKSPLKCLLNHAFSFEQGILTKFKNYLFTFQQESKQKELITLKKLARKGWLLSIDLSDLAENSSGLKLYEKALLKISRILQALNDPITKLIPQFRDDENVVFFLLTHQQSLDNIFGHLFTAKQLIAMHSTLQQSAQFLLKSYSKRKFDQLLPVISKKIAALELAL